MTMTPIKLLPEGHAKHILLKFIDDEPHLATDDFLERAVLGGSTDATSLLAIENATEIAKKYIQRHYRDILKSIRDESAKADNDAVNDRVFRCKNIVDFSGTRSAVEYIHLEAVLEDNHGHTIYIRVDNIEKRIWVYDSMGKDGYTNDFEKTIRSMYPGYKIYDKSSKFQPTGGFIQETPEQMSGAMYISGSPGYLDMAWEVSQYDELSQHHFCYIEAFVAMAFDTFKIKRKGPTDPRERLQFIKKVVWGFIQKFYVGRREGPVWEYFTKYFPMYMTTCNADGSKMRLNNGTFQVPKKGPFVKRIERFEVVDTSKWTITEILKWAAKS
jgi:hypothetical protein